MTDTPSVSVGRPRGRPAALISYAGRSQTIAQWAREVGLPEPTLRARLASGMTIAAALKRPRPRRPPSPKESS